ncbi:MAG: DNRLRE domain-containing protein [Phycisphaerales bacterium JB038]
MRRHETVTVVSHWAMLLSAAASLQAESVTATFQQGVAGYTGTRDTFLKQASPNSVYGSASVVEWDGSDGGGKNFGLLRFEGLFGAEPDQIPIGSLVVADSLFYEVNNEGNPATVNEVAVQWDESVSFNTFGAAPGVQDDDYGREIGQAAGGAGAQSFDVSTSLRAWALDPTGNRGWLFRPTGGTNGVEFRSSEYGSIAVRPKLEVSYLRLVDEIGLLPEAMEAVVGSHDLELIVAIPPGANDAAPLQVTLVSDLPDVAAPVGAVNGTLSITFAAGGPTHQVVGIDIGAVGTASISVSDGADLDDAVLPVVVEAGTLSFDPASLSSLVDLDVPVQVSLTPGSNDTRPVTVQLLTDDASIAQADGAVNGVLHVTFAAGAPPSQIVTVDVGELGETTISAASDEGLDPAALAVEVVSGFMFTATSDTRSSTGPGEFPLVLADITATGGPGAFMVCPGDIDPPQNVDAALDAKFGAGFDWYPVVGNHEAETPADMPWIRNEHGHLPHLVREGPVGCETTTYAFEFGNAHFAVINEYFDGTSDVGTDGDICDELYAWLEADLLQNTKPWVFVVGHEPAYPQPDMHWGDARHVGDSLDQYPARRDAFWALLAGHNVSAYLTAHTHRYSRYLQDDVWQIDTGQARGVGPYDTYQRWLVGEEQLVLHVYRSLADGAFRLVDTLAIDAGCEGDIDGDGKVDQTDLGLLLAAFGTTQGDQFWDPDADFNGDGIIDQRDLVIVLINYEC